MSLVLRFVECHAKEGIRIREVFFGFMNADDTTGKDLLKTFFDQVQKLYLNLQDCRAQVYDNGANMKGRNSGVQARLLEINEKALFLPCAAHTLNLILVDAAKSSATAISFFGTLNRLYIIFSSSPSRWKMITSNMPITLKVTSATRWESLIEAVKPLRYHLEEVLEAIEQLENYALEKHDGTTATGASSLSFNICSWPFIVSIMVWYDILFYVNKISKLLQSPTSSFATLECEIKASSFLQEYRDNGFTSALTNARDIAEKLGVKREFPERRPRRKKRLFDYESYGDGEKISSEEHFKSDFFFKLIDQAITSIDSRFDEMKVWTNLWKNANISKRNWAMWMEASYSWSCSVLLSSSVMIQTCPRQQQ